jgi:general secretion pathway protein D
MRKGEGTGGLASLAVSILVIASILVGTSCAWRKDFRQGQEAFQKKDWDRAVAYFLKAVREKPDKIEYRISLANALISASNHHLLQGKQYAEDGQLKLALVAFEKSLEYNPENNDARKRKHQLLDKVKEIEKQEREKTGVQQLKEKAAAVEPPVPKVKFKKKPYSLKFVRAELTQIIKALEKSSGISFIFDEGFKSKKIAINLEEVGFMEALEKLMLQNNLFYKVIDTHTLMIIPDTPAKRRDYEELVMKTLFIGSGNVEEIQKTVRTLTGMKTIAVDKELNAITFKGTPDEVKMAERITQIYDKPKAEVFIDIEIIEVNRSRVQEYGIELSQYQLTESYFPETGGAATESAISTIRLHRIGHTDASDYLLTLPSINYKLLKTDQNSRIKARPQLRGIDGEKVEVRLGDKVPIPTTSFVPYNIQGPAQQPITSYQLQDIGIIIELTPHIHYDGLVTLELKFELTFITNPGTERIPPTLGNRSVTAKIKLRDNETSILAGLLRDTERRAMRGFPFLSNIPVLKEIFSGNKNEIEQTDIILTITPRIIRFPEIDEKDMELLWVGTQAKPGLKTPPQELELEGETAAEPTAEPAKKEAKKKPDQAAAREPSANNTNNVNSVNSPPAAPPPTTAAPANNLILSFPTPAPGLKKEREAEVPLHLTGNHEIRAITLEMDFDPTLVQVLEVRKGQVLNQPGIDNLLLKNIDNQVGKLKLNISMQQPLTVTPGSDAELMVLRVKPLRTGEIRFIPVSVRVLDPELKNIAVETPEPGLVLHISE